MASVKFFLKNKALVNGEFPVYMRVTIERKKKLFKMNYSCLKSDWDVKSSEFKRSVDNYYQKNENLMTQRKKALRLFDEFESKGKELTLHQFEQRFTANKIKHAPTVFEHFQEKIKDLGKSKQTGNKKVYNETCKSLFGFVKDKNITFADIDLKLLNKYEVHLRENGGTDGGISVRMRTLRALYNEAIDLGIAKTENYPFRKYKVSKLKGGGIKKALTRAEVQLIIDLNLEQYPKLTNARHWFVFSYYTRGMNFVDMMKLEWSDIDGDRFSYTRSKTNSNFTIKMLPPVMEILEYYKTISNTKYVFPILLSNNLEANQIENRKKKILKQFNKDLKAIAAAVGITKPVSSYVARHSFATNLKHAGTATNIISESMGHQNQQVTETYLKSFENDVVDDAMEALL